ncbi:hypothetical protein [Kitasatospora sp. NPDC059571]|uniref:hypothetical protein n=1 Tax=Kitasatospora sp. NPDC059571 TaxID=3346871 RepID=UPI003681A1B5
MIDYNRRRFRGESAAPDAEATVAVYRQAGDLLWGESEGGSVRRGSLTGVVHTDGSAEFAYTMVLAGGEVVAGHCVSTPEFLPDGRIRLTEIWERFGENADRGVSYLIELPSGS